jgi:tRNA (guanine37-N1)-methyltransferase
VNIDIISVIPGMFEALQYGVLGRAVKNGLLHITCWDVRDYTEDKHRTVDDKPYGGGPGMVMMAKPLRKAILHIQAERDKPLWVVYLSPQGTLLKQPGVVRLKEKLTTHNLVLLCGRYEGIDERLIESLVDEECSIGDYVLSGGEFAAMAVIDAMVRLLPGALGDNTSADEDSFSRGLLEYPQYTRPENDEGARVPEVLLSGDHQAIARWRSRMALQRTLAKRPDLLESAQLSAEEKKILAELRDVTRGDYNE